MAEARPSYVPKCTVHAVHAAQLAPRAAATCEPCESCDLRLHLALLHVARREAHEQVFININPIKSNVIKKSGILHNTCHLQIE